MTPETATATRAVLRPVRPGATLDRLLAALATRGHAVVRAHDPGAARGAWTWVVGPGAGPDDAAAVAAGARPGDRVLALGWIGTHRDARAPELRAAWDLEERLRAGVLPVLTLRLGPLAGPDTPLWRRLAAAPPSGRVARVPMQPVLEDDVVATLDRALAGVANWEGWYELGGPDVLDLVECAAAARAVAAPAPNAAWEPAREVLLEQRLIEPQVWTAWSGVVPRTVAALRARGAA